MEESARRLGDAKKHESFDCVRCHETALVLSAAELAAFGSAVVAANSFGFPNLTVFVRVRRLSVFALGQRYQLVCLNQVGLRWRKCLWTWLFSTRTIIQHLVNLVSTHLLLNSSSLLYQHPHELHMSFPLPLLLRHLMRPQHPLFSTFPW